jgi:hypothetical protein
MSFAPLSYYSPELNDDGELKCGVDVRLPDGSHLEFTLANTGWGKSFALDVASEKASRRRKR